MNGVARLAYISSTDALRQLMQSKDNRAYIVKISSKDNKLSNGLDYCYVGLKSKDGTDYYIQAYGREARELHKEATIMAIKPIMVNLSQ